MQCMLGRDRKVILDGFYQLCPISLLSIGVLFCVLLAPVSKYQGSYRGGLIVSGSGIRMLR